ncbi:hypothetical protein Avbf_10832 [Armadillidium vulgare]|nr:hypothetical protein Avbf_10832 [Armadillidium vulgare]
MKMFNLQNILLLMTAFVTLICGVVSQGYYNNYDNYYNRILPSWRSSFRRESSAPAWYGRQSRSRSYGRRNTAPVDAVEE